MFLGRRQVFYFSNRPYKINVFVVMVNYSKNMFMIRRFSSSVLWFFLFLILQLNIAPTVAVNSLGMALNRYLHKNYNVAVA